MSPRALRDLDRFSRREQDRVEAALEALAADPSARNLDIAPIVGHPPWQRLRIGSLRVLLRSEAGGYIIDRVVNRRDLGRAIVRLS